MNNKTLIWVLVIGVVVVIGGWFFLSNKNKMNADNDSQEMRLTSEIQGEKI